ncbi:MAG TPA: GTPase HflX, partial [Lacipirellulaceae bacterium]|nr:GTPase HflX [Lacipirellulaceae bacterium]
MKEIDRKQGVQSESAILVGVELPNSETARDDLNELAGLVETAGAEIVGRLTQKRQVPDQTTYLGKGKVEQLELMIRATDADVVIFDNNLAPAQIRNLETELGVKVLDRTEVILDIFSTRAQTHEARLAVELAQLEYSLPRLKRMWSHLSRIKAGVGMRGPGEKQLETDRRLVEKRISDLRGELNQVHRRKEREVAARSDRMTVSLIGYTNAGKSTLLNKLTGADVLAEDKLFATLDTRTRRWQLPAWGPVLLSDTVGFIRDLPHSLIASFKATLEEARQADLLLHVADASNPAALEQIAAVYKVLEELDINQKDTILVLNQIDAIAELGTLDHLKERYPSAIGVSAKTGEGLNRLASAVSEALTHHFLEVDIDTGVANGRLLAALAQHGEILSRTYTDDRVSVHGRMPRKFLGQIPHDEARIKLRS